MHKAVWALAALTLGACASEREAIDRTQPNAIRKDSLAGEWYFQQTVVDIPGTYSATFVGETNFGGMERVRFDVQEDWLYVRRSYEKIQNAEGGANGDAPSPDYMGAILAAYRIQSHFDIKRAYNPTTGEEYNVIEENSVDRPWYERDYLRVDWSTNYATNFQFMVDDMAVDPVAYYVQDTDLDHDGKPDDPDYPIIEDGYMDVTNIVATRPGLTYFEEIGATYPTCYLFSRATSDCTTEEIKIRNSFLRLDPNRQYIPEPFKGDVTEYFGLFTTDRMVYDPKTEVSERQRLRYRQVHNLWKNWYTEDAEGKRTVIEPKDREVRPMLYYVHNWPADQEGSLAQVQTEWNNIFKDVVKSTGNPYDGDVLIFCHSPVRDTDNSACGEPGFTVRIGDIRYNWISYQDKYYDGFALLGLGPSNSDPLTGEVISAGAYLYIYNDIVAQTTAEQIQLLNGDLDPTQYIDGLDLSSWQGKASAGLNMEAKAVDPELAHKIAARTRTTPAAGLHANPTPAQMQSINGMSMKKFLKQYGSAFFDQGLFSPDGNDGEGRITALENSYIENLMLNSEMQLAAGIAPGTQANFNDEMLEKASISRVGPFRLMQAIENKKRMFADQRNVDLFLGVDDGYAGIAKEMKGKSQDEIRAAVKDKVFHAVLAHELGHSFNLHHNFGGTEDVVNYGDQYWELRKADGSVKPRFEDPISQAEVDGNIYRYAYSSIMDYSRLTLDFGPGKYDRAAILLGYADKVEVFKSLGNMDASILNDWSSNDGQIIQFFLTGPVAFHYTEWYRLMGDLVYKADNRKLVDAANINWDAGISAADGAYRVPYIFCSPYQSDIGNNCYTRDYGADEYERVTHHVEGARTWYITRAFPRFQIGSDVNSYIGRSYDRLYGRLKNYNDLYALYTGLFAQIYTPDQIEAFLTDPTKGWGSYTLAQGEALNFLLETVAMPDVTGFEATKDAAGREVLAKSLFSGAAVNTDVTNARFFTTSWSDTNFNDDCGMYFYECLNHYGFYLDKVMAMYALTDSQTNFVARDTAEDIREFRISFYDTYPQVIDEFFAGLMSQDWSAFAPRWTGSDIALPNWMTGEKPAGQVIDPSTGFTVQLYAAVLGMARFQNNFDKGFLVSTRTWVKGSSFGVNGPRGVVEFVSPDGTTYQAVNFGVGEHGGGIAKRMIQYANDVKKRSSSCGDDCAANVTAAEKTKADLELVRYSQLLDIMVDLTGYYETYTQKFGPAYDPGAL